MAAASSCVVAESPGVIAVVKIVALRVDVDDLSGAVTVDDRRLGLSPADAAAIDVARRLAEHRRVEWGVVSVAPPSIEPALRECGAGAATLTRVALQGDSTITRDEWLESATSSLVAAALAEATRHADVVVAGEHSLDRGSGSVPPRLAYLRGLPGAFGLTDVEVSKSIAHRRRASGWRDQIALPEKVVLSVEASAGSPWRASISDVRAAVVQTFSSSFLVNAVSPKWRPFRARHSDVTPPREEVAARRAMEVIGALTPPRVREVLTVDPATAATAIIERLQGWGYLA